MNPTTLARLKSGIRDVYDFPKPGIIFKDITPLLADPALLKLSMDALMDTLAGHKIDKIVAIDARGFIFAGSIAERLGAGLVPIRKKGKLPYKCETISYDLEYGSNVIQIHQDAIAPGETVWMIDDVLATGGTSAAAVALIHKLGGKLLGMSFLLELSFLNGRKFLPEGIPVHGVVVY